MRKNEVIENKVTDKYQTVVPKEIREKAGIEKGDTLVWKYDESKKQIIIIPIPRNISDSLLKLGGNYEHSD